MWKMWRASDFEELPVSMIWQNCLYVDSVSVIWQNCLYLEERASVAEIVYLWTVCQ
jgi:hypothetical protein